MSSLAKHCRVKAEEGGFASLMNDTKWRELCMAFAAFEKKPVWRARDLLTGYVSGWDSEWYHHVGPDYCSIEWLEIERGVSRKEEIRSVLESVGVPFDETDSYFRVIGYRK